MTVRTILRDLAPPLLLRILRTVRGLDKNYATWDDALKASGSYSDETLNRFRIDRAALNKDMKSEPSHNPLYALTLLMGGNLEIVDCGGSTGPNGLALIEACPSVRYTVMESPTLVSMMPKGGPIRFVSELPDAFDIFYAGGTIQYLKDPLGLLDGAFKSARRAVVLERSSFSDKPAIHVQRVPLFFNGGGRVPPGYTDRMIAYPHQTVRESDIHKLARAKGFELVSRTPEAITGNAIFDAGLYGAQLIYLRT